MGKFSREKGKRGERRLAITLKNYGYDCRRGQQYCGSHGDADVVGLPGIHIECKFVEDLNIKAALLQSINDARENEIPVVMHKKSYEHWKVTMLSSDFKTMQRESEVFPKIIKKYQNRVTLWLDDWIQMYREWEAGRYGNVSSQ